MLYNSSAGNWGMLNCSRETTIIPLTGDHYCVALAPSEMWPMIQDVIAQSGTYDIREHSMFRYHISPKRDALQFRHSPVSELYEGFFNPQDDM